jgi:hypothetical protein
MNDRQLGPYAEPSSVNHLSVTGIRFAAKKPQSSSVAGGKRRFAWLPSFCFFCPIYFSSFSRNFAFGEIELDCSRSELPYPKVQNKQALSLPKPADCENIRPLEVLHYGETMLQRP